MYSVEDINRMVMEYKAGNPNVLDPLLEGMRPYLTKWVNVLSGAHINTLDDEIQSFVSLFGCTSMIDVKDRLRHVFYYMTPEDMYDELIVKFIERILLYKDGGPGFLGYLKGTFRYVIKRWVDSEGRSPYVEYQDMDTVEDSDISIDLPDTHIMTDTSILKSLSQKERRILYLKYVDGRTNTEIAAVYNLSPNTVSLIIARAKAKLIPNVYM